MKKTSVEVKPGAKTAATLTLAITLALGSTIPAWADGGQWKQDATGWWYQRADTSYPTSSWEKINGTWYHFDAKGYMQTGWQKIDSAWYYFASSGAMVTGWNKVGTTWYYHNVSGVMLTGWQRIGGAWYLFGSDGAMKTGWQQVGGKWYYLYSSGVMAANAWIGNYWVDSNGIMATNSWVDGEKYYVNENGVWDPKEPRPTERQLEAVQYAKRILQNQYPQYSGLSCKELMNLLTQAYGVMIEEIPKFSYDDAAYAVNHSGADWNCQAMIRAQSSLRGGFVGYSPDMLINDLEGWGFTYDQAIYAIKHVNVNWNKQAEIFAQNALQNESTSFSYNGLIKFLESFGFTHEQAVYGADRVDISQINGKENALAEAKDLLEKKSGWSRRDLIRILEESGYSFDEAVYGADHSEADWNEQAVSAAKEALLYTHCYPRIVLIEWLEENYGFTYDEAVYGADHSGADWNEYAVMVAKELLQNTNELSRELLVETLETSYHFSFSEAVYGADHCGVIWTE